MVAACLLSPCAEAAGDRRDMQLSPPQAAAEHTLIDLGGIVLKFHTSSIVLGAADNPLAVPDRPFGFPMASFAAARSAGSFSVTGVARASLTVTFDFSDILTGHNGRIPLPIGSIARAAQASLALDPGGKLSVLIGSSFGFSAGRSGGAVRSGGFSFSANPLKPWKHMSIRYRVQF